MFRWKSLLIQSLTMVDFLAFSPSDAEVVFWCWFSKSGQGYPGWMKSDVKFTSDLVIEHISFYFFSFSLVLFPSLNQL